MAVSRIEDLLTESERQERQPPVRLHLILPPAVLAGSVVLLWLTGNLGKAAAAAGSSFFLLGKFVVLSGAMPESSFDLTALELAALVVFMDVLCAWFLAYNLHWVYRIRRLGIGPGIQRLVDYCQYWLHHRPWMRRWAFTGVMLFVLFPLTGTGAPGGSILGRLVGLRSRTTLIAILTGSVLGCGLMAAFATRLQPLFAGIKDAPWFKASGIGILAIVVVALLVLGRRVSRASRELARSQSGGDA